MDPFDSESYWHRSTSKAFNFDDDNDVDFGTLAGGSKLECGGILSDDAISEASFDNGASGCALSFSIKTLISEEALQMILEEQTLDDGLIPKGVTPEEELKLLRRQMQATLYSPSPKVTAHKLLLGKSVSLEAYRSLHDKQLLLDAVLENGGGGDAVISVLLFLEKTLNRENFHGLLARSPKAQQHFISYLKQQQPEEAVTFLKDFGQHNEAALLQFRAAFATSEFVERKHKLHQLVEDYARSTHPIPLYQQVFHAALKLLELVEKERNALDNLVDIQSTPVEVLRACCAKHVNWKDQDLVRSTSPFRLCAEQQISASQFEWTALNERAQARAYADLESIFERVSAWHPMKQKQFHISFSMDLAVLRLHQLQAPASVLYMFLSHVGNASEKLALARRVKCTRATIDALLALRDVQQLVQLRETLAERSEEQFYCDKALKSAQNKRWSTDNIKLKL